MASGDGLGQLDVQAYSFWTQNAQITHLPSLSTLKSPVICFPSLDILFSSSAEIKQAKCLETRMML